ATLSTAGTTTMSAVALQYLFGSTPMAVFFDRSDLDALPVGHAEAQDPIQAPITGTTTVTTNGMQQMQTVEATLSLTQSWRILEKTGTFAVLGHTYDSVVKVQLDTSVAAGDGAGTAAVQQTSTYWLAKGIGLVRGEDATQISTGTAITVSEL